MNAGPMSLEELASDWQRPAEEEHFSLPAITNFRGMVQSAWDITGIQNWICAPTGMSTPTVLLYFREGGRIRRFPRCGIEYRWKAYEIERRGHGVHSVVRMPAGRTAVAGRIRLARDLHVYLVFTGLPRVWRFTDYWNLPPWDVPQLNVQRTDTGFLLDDVKTFARAAFAIGQGAAQPRVHPVSFRIWRDLDAWLADEPPTHRGGLGVAELHVRAGDEIDWYATQTAEEALEPAPLVRDEPSAAARTGAEFQRLWDSGRAEWERVWNAAFTPGNAEFSGHLPTYEQATRALGPHAPPLARLYSMAVLTLLMTRRFIPAPTPRSLVATGGQCIWTPPEAHDDPPAAKATDRVPGAAARLARAYVWGGPEGAPTTSFLWEVEFQAPLLARLDPLVLREQLEALMRVDLQRHWGIETVSGAGAGMGYGVNPGAFLSCVRDYVRITGDRAWAQRHVEYLKGCLRPELTDYGDCQNILECVPSYEHTVASFNALAVQGLRFMADLLEPDGSARSQSANASSRELRAAAEALAQRVLSLFEDGPWACVQPDGSRRVVRTILDFVYVGRCMTGDLPEDVQRRMLAFFERELQTADWAFALSPRDPDARTTRLPEFQTLRADHQATGSYDGWPARAASVLLRLGQREKAIAWLLRMQELTREGPFGQAHYIHSDGTTRKASFFNGNCYFEAAGCGLATTILEDLTAPP